MLYHSICATAFAKTFMPMSATCNPIYRSSSSSSMPAVDYKTLVRNRRLRVIVRKVLESGRKDPLLMLRLCWVSFVTLVVASALACHKVVVSMSEEDYLGRLSFTPKKLVVSN